MNIKEDLTCKYCIDIYQNPVTLTCCGDNICKQHVEEFLSNNQTNKFSCPLCNEENSNQSLKVNKFMQKMVKTELHKFKINFKHKETLENLKIEIERLAGLLNDPENFIYEEMNELKRQVDLDREELKSKIDELADDIIQQLESYEQKFKTECKANVEIEHYNGLVESSRTQLSEYQNFLDLFSVESEERDKQSKAGQEMINALQSNIQEFKQKLISNLSITYKANENKVEDLFGKLIVKVCLMARIFFSYTKIYNKKKQKYTTISL